MKVIFENRIGEVWDCTDLISQYHFYGDKCSYAVMLNDNEAIKALGCQDIVKFSNRDDALDFLANSLEKLSSTKFWQLKGISRV